jgi:hypothetical protein
VRFDFSLTPAHHDLIARTHRFVEEVVRPVAARYKLGCRASHTAELRFEGVRVPADPLLGGDAKLAASLDRAREAQAEAAGRGGGKDRGSAALGAFEQTRPMVAAQALGIARAALEYAARYATEREAFGGPIIDKQGVSFPLADLAADLDAARLLSREVVPGRQALHDLRGHERDPAHGDRPRGRRGRWRAAAPPRLPGRRPAAVAPVRPRHSAPVQGRHGGAEVDAADARAGAAGDDEGARPARARAPPVEASEPRPGVLRIAAGERSGDHRRP